MAGLALMPGGVGMLVAMAVTGKLVEKINPKLILGSGICIQAYSMYMMLSINLYTDYATIAWTRIVMGIGLGMLAVPLLSLSFSSIENEDIGNATSVFALLRNISLSSGAALIVTLFSVRSQFHQSRLSEVVDPFNPRFLFAVQRAMAIISVKKGTFSSLEIHGIIYQQLMREAALAAFVDTFYAAGVVVLFALPFVFLLKRPKDGVPTMSFH